MERLYQANRLLDQAQRLADKEEGANTTRDEIRGRFEAIDVIITSAINIIKAHIEDENMEKTPLGRSQS
jgi:glutamyl-tRNA reductase